jgi:hypothetical protein
MDIYYDEVKEGAVKSIDKKSHSRNFTFTHTHTYTNTVGNPEYKWCPQT